MLHALAEVSIPALARRAAALVGEYIDHRPDGAAQAAAYVDRRLNQGPAARAVLFPLVTGLLRGALAPALVASGSPASRLLRAELPRRTAGGVRACTPASLCTGPACSSSVPPRARPATTGRW
ncbi:hypothetical protein ACFYXH_20580 [Streptomyces sp. NPDC002730]|uniref:hypothetical protein n=1 Tax=Streptomyces sp. NPDC002730 TaxID=3364662 RepID=UPI0036C0C600